jgi:hypothetical protein
MMPPTVERLLIFAGQPVPSRSWGRFFPPLFRSVFAAVPCSELGELSILLPEAEIELAITGFDIAETELIIADHAEPPAESAADKLPDPGPRVSRLHDLWIMARHRLYCGNARDPATYATLMRGDSATMVFADPPYNVSMRTHARGRSRIAFEPAGNPNEKLRLYSWSMMTRRKKLP